MVAKQAIILGATGLIGQSVVARLLADDRYEQVLAFSRRDLAQSHPKLKVEIIDFVEMESHADKFVGDELYCCLGTTMKKAGSEDAFKWVDYEIPYRAAQIAQNNGLQHYLIVTAMGADPKSYFFYNRVKGEIEKDLAALNLPRLSILRPGLLIGNRDEQRLGESIAQSLSKVFSPILPGAYKPIAGDTVAKAMINIANQQVEKSLFSSAELQDLGKD